MGNNIKGNLSVEKVNIEIYEKDARKIVNNFFLREKDDLKSLKADFSKVSGVGLLSSGRGLGNFTGAVVASVTRGSQTIKLLILSIASSLLVLTKQAFAKFLFLAKGLISLLI